MARHPTLEAIAAPGVTPLLVARLLRSLSGRLLQATLFWEVYALSGSKAALGLLGLVEFLPAIPAGLLAGALADARDRVRMAQLAQLGAALACLGLALFGSSSLPAMLALACLASASGAFEMPALSTLLPNLVPRDRFASAVAVTATVRNVGWNLGPIVAGLLIDAHGAAPAFGLAAALSAGSAAVLSGLPRVAAAERRAVTLRAVAEGIAFLRRAPAVRGAMTLDMFAVIFAGATALLPVYATEILHVDAKGYGLLSSALAIGTFAMSGVLTLRPGLARPGRALFVAVAVFGLATIAFGFSRLFWLSFASLVVAGMADEVSMVARQIIIQLGTPDALRGRVSAVNFIFVGASNELGAAESGFLAQLTSATFSVVFGGFACLGVLGVVGRLIPDLRRFRLSALVALLVGAGGLAGASARAESGAQAATLPARAVDLLYAPHYGPEGFFVPWARDTARTAGGLLRWQLAHNPYAGRPRRAAPRVANDGALLARDLPLGQARVTWVGHATFAVQDGADVFLTDPHFGARALWPTRLAPPGVPLEAIPADAFAVISHNHYDHLDADTVERLPASVAWFVPLGMASWFRERGRENVRELDWWQSERRGRWTITCLPSQHWSRRIGQGVNEALWCTWLLDSGQHRYFFAGDTGYFAGFAEYGRRFASIDAALLPIGAYEPRWFMQFQHLDPAQAWRAFGELGASTLFPMHWGTFDLTDEPPDEPPLELRRAIARAGGDPGRVAWLAIGEARELRPRLGPH